MFEAQVLKLLTGPDQTRKLTELWSQSVRDQNLIDSSDPHLRNTKDWSKTGLNWSLIKILMYMFLGKSVHFWVISGTHSPTD